MHFGEYAICGGVMDLVVDLLLVTEAVGGSWFTNQPPAFDDQSISHDQQPV